MGSIVILDHRGDFGELPLGWVYLYHSTISFAEKSLLLATKGCETGGEIRE